MVIVAGMERFIYFLGAVHAEEAVLFPIVSMLAKIVLIVTRSTNRKSLVNPCLTEGDICCIMYIA